MWPFYLPFQFHRFRFRFRFRDKVAIFESVTVICVHLLAFKSWFEIKWAYKFWSVYIAWFCGMSKIMVKCKIVVNKKKSINLVWKDKVRRGSGAKWRVQLPVFCDEILHKKWYYEFNTFLLKSNRKTFFCQSFCFENYYASYTLHIRCVMCNEQKWVKPQTAIKTLATLCTANSIKLPFKRVITIECDSMSFIYIPRNNVVFRLRPVKWENIQEDFAS